MLPLSSCFKHSYRLKQLFLFYLCVFLRSFLELFEKYLISDHYFQFNITTIGL